MARDTISILDGSTFVVSDRRGDIDANPSQHHGLFHRDTRFLSRWRVTVNGLSPDPLSVEHEQYFSAQFFLVPATGSIYKNPYLSVIRKRMVGDGFHEDVAVLNHDNEPATVELRIEAGADFADQASCSGSSSSRTRSGARASMCFLAPATMLRSSTSTARRLRDRTCARPSTSGSSRRRSSK
nr:hypothetical protein [Actinomycetota bacterium]